MSLSICARCLGLLAVASAVRIAEEAPPGSMPTIEELSPFIEDDDMDELGKVSTKIDADAMQKQKERMLRRQHIEALIAGPQEDVYVLSEPSAEWGGLKSIAKWNRKKTETDPVTISYNGDRQGFEARSWDFDVDTDHAAQWSIRYRDTGIGRMDSLGFGNYFYKKFAILPKGKTANKDSLWTVKMIEEDFEDGRRTWALTKGYCKQHLGGFVNSCNEAGRSEPSFYMYCKPGDQEEEEEEQDDPSSPGYFKPGTPFSCMVTSMPLRSMPDESMPQIWLRTKDGKLELKNTGASDSEAELLAAVGTAIKPAYDLGLYR